jgi:NADH dehydrogenase
VRVLVLPGDPALARLADIPGEVVPADVADASSLAGCCDGVQTVYHLAAVILSDDPEQYRRINVNGTRNMIAEALRAGVDHFVLVSSAAAMDPASSPYARSKYEAEEILKKQKEMAWTIVRPTLVYERGGGQEFMLFMAALERFPVVPFVGRGAALKNPVHSDDLIRGLAAIAGNPLTRGKSYNFSGGEAITILELARLILYHRGGQRPFVYLPLWLCRGLASLGERLLRRPPLTLYGISRIEAEANPDNSEARRDLGYNPIGVREGLQRCYPLPTS